MTDFFSKSAVAWGKHASPQHFICIICVDRRKWADLIVVLLVAPGITGRAGTAMAIVKIVDKKSKRRCGCSSKHNANSKDWNDPIGGPCVDIDSEITPLLHESVPESVMGKVNHATLYIMCNPSRLLTKMVSFLTAGREYKLWGYSKTGS